MKYQIKSVLFICGAAICAVFASPVTMAQQSSEATASNWLKDTQITIGLGAGVMPRYAGSNEYRAVPVPVLNVTSSSGFFVESLQGVGFRHDINDILFASASIGYDAGRKESNSGLSPGSAKLRGMGEIKGAAVANIEAGVKLGSIGNFSIGISEPLSDRERGMTYHAQLSTPVLVSSQDNVSVSGGVVFGSAKYNQTFFGVTATQSAHSGYVQYKSGAGVNAVNAALSWTHSFNATWSVSSMVGATHYQKEAARSPLVFAKTNYSAFTTLNYSF